MTNTNEAILARIDARIAKVQNVLVGADHSGRYDIGAEAQMTMLRDIRADVVDVIALASEPEIPGRNATTTIYYAS